MICIFCKKTKTSVVEIRYRKDGTPRRRRACLNCEKTFMTVEVPGADYDLLREFEGRILRLKAFLIDYIFSVHGGK